MTGVAWCFWKVMLIFGVKIGALLLFSKNKPTSPMIINWSLPNFESNYRTLSLYMLQNGDISIETGFFVSLACPMIFQ